MEWFGSRSLCCRALRSCSRPPQPPSLLSRATRPSVIPLQSLLLVWVSVARVTHSSHSIFFHSLPLSLLAFSVILLPSDPVLSRW